MANPGYLTTRDDVGTAQAVSQASHGLAGWSLPAYAASTGQTLATASGGFLGAGRIHGARIYVPASRAINTLSVFVVTAGATLTSGQNKAAIWTDAGALLATSADQSTQWTTTGIKGMTLDSTVNLVGGNWYRVGLWFNGTTSPAFARGAANATVNIGQTDPTLMEFWTSADTSVTTAAPATLTGPYAAMNGAIFLALGPT